jgi:hypothetical protein
MHSCMVRSHSSAANRKGKHRIPLFCLPSLVCCVSTTSMNSSAACSVAVQPLPCFCHSRCHLLQLLIRHPPLAAFGCPNHRCVRRPRWTSCAAAALILSQHLPCSLSTHAPPSLCRTCMPPPQMREASEVNKLCSRFLDSVTASALLSFYFLLMRHPPSAALACAHHRCARRPRLTSCAAASLILSQHLPCSLSTRAPPSSCRTCMPPPQMREASEVDKLCSRLEEAAGPITLRWSTSRSSPDASTMDKLAGTWRLVYSSGFNGGSLGGSRPGPPAALVPTVLGQVYQVIDADKVGAGCAIVMCRG